ncbi:hypothetical protein AVEN_242988-1 [Araneus ventricosus]|uniref:Uncharacterized protein n=1 Tax=Araneus ventricosus TaxID=182803 RepID=A0A4Y2D552_ARAVE|nr:hypothetical protein AVEN_242988-1 [Araneus ventricosus]
MSISVNSCTRILVGLSAVVAWWQNLGFRTGESEAAASIFLKFLCVCGPDACKSVGGKCPPIDVEECGVEYLERMLPAVVSPCSFEHGLKLRHLF